MPRRSDRDEPFGTLTWTSFTSPTAAPHSAASVSWTGERAAWRDVKRRGRHLPDSDLESGSDVQTVEQSLETLASQLDIGEPNGERLCTCKWL